MSNHREFLAKLSRSIIADEESVKQLERDNILKDSIDRELVISSKNFKNIEVIRGVLYNLRKSVIEYNSIFKNNRKKLLEGEVDNSLRYLFPDENFGVKFEMSSLRGKETVNLQLGQDGVYSGLKAQNGRFVRQLVALITLYTINKLRGSNILFMDEALSSGDSGTLELLKPIIEKIIEDGTQMLIIEHKHELYENLPRKTFYLSKDRKNRCVLLDREVVYE